LARRECGALVEEVASDASAAAGGLLFGVGEGGALASPATGGGEDGVDAGAVAPAVVLVRLDTGGSAVEVVAEAGGWGEGDVVAEETGEGLGMRVVVVAAALSGAGKATAGEEM